MGLQIAHNSQIKKKGREGESAERLSRSQVLQHRRVGVKTANNGIKGKSPTKGGRKTTKVRGIKGGVLTTPMRRIRREEIPDGLIKIRAKKRNFLS